MQSEWNCLKHDLLTIIILWADNLQIQWISKQYLQKYPICFHSEFSDGNFEINPLRLQADMWGLKYSAKQLIFRIFSSLIKDAQEKNHNCDHQFAFEHQENEHL